MSSIFEALQQSKLERFEAEVLLSHVLSVSRAYLHTWPQQALSSIQHEIFFDLVGRRLQGEPIAYLVGHQGFWTLDLIVSPAVLIPRPETELLVELVLQHITVDEARIADLGTGSGAIALALASEKKQWQLHATDRSDMALAIAQKNAARLALTNVQFFKGSWCEPLPLKQYDAIVSNPPYIAPDDKHLQQGDLRFEPLSALVADENGLKDIAELALCAKNYLKPGGSIYIEHGFDQADSVVALFKSAGYQKINSHFDLLGISRVVIATR